MQCFITRWNTEKRVENTTRSGVFLTNFEVNNSGLEIATDTVAYATNIFSLATKNSGLVAKVATRFLYALDLN